MAQQLELAELQEEELQVKFLLTIYNKLLGIQKDVKNPEAKAELFHLGTWIKTVDQHFQRVETLHMKRIKKEGLIRTLNHGKIGIR